MSYEKCRRKKKSQSKRKSISSERGVFSFLYTDRFLFESFSTERTLYTRTYRTYVYIHIFNTCDRYQIRRRVVAAAVYVRGNDVRPFTAVSQIVRGTVHGRRRRALVNGPVPPRRAGGVSSAWPRLRPWDWVRRARARVFFICPTTSACPAAATAFVGQGQPGGTLPAPVFVFAPSPPPPDRSVLFFVLFCAHLHAHRDYCTNVCYYITRVSSLNPFKCNCYIVHAASVSLDSAATAAVATGGRRHAIPARIS